MVLTKLDAEEIAPYWASVRQLFDSPSCNYDSLLTPSSFLIVLFRGLRVFWANEELVAKKMTIANAAKLSISRGTSPRQENLPISSRDERLVK